MNERATTAPSVAARPVSKTGLMSSAVCCFGGDLACEQATANGSGGVAFNCLWPRTGIATAAIDMYDTAAAAAVVVVVSLSFPSLPRRR